jgi:hypothetical protein
LGPRGSKRDAGAARHVLAGRRELGLGIKTVVMGRWNVF